MVVDRITLMHFSSSCCDGKMILHFTVVRKHFNFSSTDEILFQILFEGVQVIISAKHWQILMKY